MYLGDAMAERLEREFRVIDDERINGTVARITERIARHLPPTSLKFKVRVVDLPELNAFTMAGGRIYVTRKLIAFVRDEDELAGIIAHELGHAIVRHGTIDISRAFKEILGVEQFADRKDVFTKYNELIEKRRTRNVRTSRNHEDDQQVEADNIAVFAMSAAGYDPNQFATAFDRLSESEGKTGNWFSDLFGNTKPAQKRLRKIVDAVKSLPKECSEAPSSVSKEDFQGWQSDVIAYSGLVGKEKLSYVAGRKTLAPKLLDEVSYLEFSPDGKYVAAVDDSGITVLKREPFDVSFRIDCAEVREAHFTPDSRFVAFTTTSMRVEQWSVDEKKPVLAREIFVRGDCWQTALSPDGNAFVCYATDSDLKIIDVRTNEMIFRKEKFYVPNFVEYYAFILGPDGMGDINAFQMRFSPSGRYFVAGRVFRLAGGGGLLGRFSNSEIFGFDFKEKKEIRIDKDIKDIVSSPFEFMDDEKIVGQHRTDEEKSGIFEFPSGKRIEKFLLRGESFTMPRKGKYLLVRPVSNAPVGVFDLELKRFRVANKIDALAVYGENFVTERKNGELGYYSMNKGELVRAVNLPESRFGRLRTAYVSPDLNWLVVSGRSRGGVWSLINGDRYYYATGFRGAYVDDGLKVWVDFPASLGQKRQIGTIDLKTAQLAPGFEVDVPNTKQYGKYLVTIESERAAREKAKQREKEKEKNANDRPLSENPDDYGVRRDGTFEVRDVRTNRVLWRREFKDELPTYGFSAASNAFTFRWSLRSETAKELIRADEKLSKMQSRMGDKNGDYLVQVVQGDTGRVTGATLIETGEGSFRARRTMTDGDWLGIIDSENRVLLYSLSTGQLKHRYFGSVAAIGKEMSIAAIENVPGRLSLYDLGSGDEIEEMNFRTPVTFLQFNADASRLLVLSDEQESIIIDIAALRKRTADLIP
jgi:WD40 repeat protein